MFDTAHATCDWASRRPTRQRSSAPLLATYTSEACRLPRGRIPRPEFAPLNAAADFSFAITPPPPAMAVTGCAD